MDPARAYFSRKSPYGWLLGIVLAALAGSFVYAMLDVDLERENDEPGPSDPNIVYSANQPVEIWHDSRWYQGKVRAVSGERYFILYDGYSVSWNEWVTARRLRPRGR